MTHVMDQFSFLGNRALYEFIELDMSTVPVLSIPSSRPLTFPGGQSKNGYRARRLIELGFSREEKREKMEIKAEIGVDRLNTTHKLVIM